MASSYTLHEMVCLSVQESIHRNNNGCKLTTSIFNSFLIILFFSFAALSRTASGERCLYDGASVSIMQISNNASVVTTHPGLPALMRDLPPFQLVPLSQMATLLMKCLPSSSLLHYATVSLGPPFCSPYHVAG